MIQTRSENTDQDEISFIGDLERTRLWVYKKSENEGLIDFFSGPEFQRRHPLTIKSGGSLDEEILGKFHGAISQLAPGMERVVKLLVESGFINPYFLWLNQLINRDLTHSGYGDEVYEQTLTFLDSNRSCFVSEVTYDQVADSAGKKKAIPASTITVKMFLEKYGEIWKPGKMGIVYDLGIKPKKKLGQALKVDKKKNRGLTSGFSTLNVRGKEKSGKPLQKASMH